ncbi:putative ATP-dependent RNA helicase DDX56 [Amblyomma americanum]|uniref:RNA helicase n=1 Tax=Amblyomma americanum TaxID=6943 RepID=A0AAQ4D9X2_AMBAM
MSETELEFHEMGLDDRLLKAIAKLGWGKPTPIQEKAVPLILEGKDVLARARTGSGKTGGFCLPLIHRLMQYRGDEEQATRGIILAPTKELCGQIARCVSQLAGQWLRCVDVSGTADLAVQRPLLAERPAIVVGTPSRLLAHIKAGHLTLKLELLVIDEADLVLSFGHEQDLNELLTRLPNRCQTVLTSATLSPEVLNLKRLALRNPVTLKLQDGDEEQQRLAQYVIRCEEDDKFALLCALLKLRLVVGKTLIFVTTVDRCFIVKLFLEQFGVRCCVLNSELPLASRAFILNQFNEGRYEIMVASDEKGIEAVAEKGKGVKRRRNQDPEYGVCRGLDFQNVANVINLDFPTTVQAYQHRVGRTARGDRKGTALSLVKDREAHLLEAVQKTLPEGTLKPYLFRMEEIEPFRYRSKDALRAVTRIAVREARLKEIKTEMLSSQKLQSFFEENPREKQLLRHDKALHIIKHQPHLKHLPDYIIPPTLQRSLQKEGATKAGPPPVKRPKTREERNRKYGKKPRRNDPLQTFSCE